jgi:Flp pilus assembly protein TadB
MSLGVAEMLDNTYDQFVGRDRLAVVAGVVATVTLAVGLWVSGRPSAAADVAVAGAIFQAMIGLRNANARRRQRTSSHDRRV